MLDIIKYLTSSFFVWLGVVLLIATIGWALNAVLVGLR